MKANAFNRAEKANSECSLSVLSSILPDASEQRNKFKNRVDGPLLYRFIEEQELRPQIPDDFYQTRFKSKLTA